MKIRFAAIYVFILCALGVVATKAPTLMQWNGPPLQPGKVGQYTIAAQARFINQHIPPQVLKYLGWTPRQVEQKLRQIPRIHNSCELFAGTAGISKQIIALSGNAEIFDIKRDPVQQNLCCVEGMALALLLVLHVMAKGLLWIGFPCTTMVWIARAVMMRTSDNPEGNCLRKDVRDANFMAWYCAKLMVLSAMRNVYYIIEQPASSKLWELNPMVWAKAITNSDNVHGDLGAWGHQMAKPSSFEGTAPYLHHLNRTLKKAQKALKDSTDSYSVRISSTGKKQVNGKPALKASEHYPKSFCKMIAAFVMKKKSYTTAKKTNPEKTKKANMKKTKKAK